MNVDSRYPYTYAADLIRSFAGHNESGLVLSRADAAAIKSGIAKAIGMDENLLASKLADYYLANSDMIEKRNLERMMRIFYPRNC